MNHMVHYNMKLKKNKGFIKLLNDIINDIKKSNNTISYNLSYKNIIN